MSKPDPGFDADYEVGKFIGEAVIKFGSDRAMAILAAAVITAGETWTGAEWEGKMIPAAERVMEE